MAGVACHEVMHALGADHEHVRPGIFKNKIKEKILKNRSR